MQKPITFCAFFLFAFAYSQQADSTALIGEIQIDAYKKPQNFITSTKSVMVTSPLIQGQNSPERLLESINLLPGSSMEERSPGSYRLSIRGSTLRSPFGVRNVKIYLDDFILSDVTGNTYLNVVDPQLIQSTEIYKGPEGGDFGSVTGGTALLRTGTTERKNFGISAGSFNLFKEYGKYSAKSGDHFFTVFQSFINTESYRENSAFKRGSLFLKDVWIYAPEKNLNFLLLYSNLHYETPGGLTLEQMKENRRQARPATSTLPGAAAQQAGIYNQFVLAGLSHEMKISDNFSHFLLFQSSFNGLKNPFITNFEKRQEENYAFRTHFNYEKNTDDLEFQTRIGFEGGINKTFIRNYNNLMGNSGNPQKFDQIDTRSGFAFLSQKLNYNGKLFADASLSYNLMQYQWTGIFPEHNSGEVNFTNQWLPNFGVSWLIAHRWSLRGKIGKGNSAPSSEEIRSSTQEFNPDLTPEYGWNKELGIRKQFGNSFYIEVSAFDFRLKDAIVRRQNDAGQEFFVNAGGTVQKGLEVITETKKFNFSSPFLSALKVYFSGSFYDFTFRDYRKDDEDYSGNQLTGVPNTNLASLVSFEFFKKIKLDYSNYYISEFPLNDAGNVNSEPVIYGNISASFPFKINSAEITATLNVLNVYNNNLILGYDTNAFGGRYYNPSAKRNLNLGIAVQF